MAEIPRPSLPISAGPEESSTAANYAIRRARVDAAHRWMRTVAAGRHTPAEVRTAAAELTAALRDATAAATSALSQPGWSAELVRLSQISVWLRRTTLDELGVHIPTTVRVANYGATGPRIPGMGFGADAVRQPEGPRIGVDLPSIIDGDDPHLPTVERPVATAPAPAEAA